MGCITRYLLGSLCVYWWWIGCSSSMRLIELFQARPMAHNSLTHYYILTVPFCSFSPIKFTWQFCCFRKPQLLTLSKGGMLNGFSAKGSSWGRWCNFHSWRLVRLKIQQCLCDLSRFLGRLLPFLIREKMGQAGWFGWGNLGATWQ